jgi:RNA polymerase sigma-70 factor (ECF subfamily)
MGTLTGALTIPGFGSEVAAKTRVDYQNTAEGSLVQRAQAGDETAFREIVERYQSKVFSIIHGIVRQRNDVEDIAQQVFAKVYLSIKSFDFRSSLITWIYKITVNECYDYLRKKRVRKLVYESDFSQEDAQRMEASEPAVDASVPADTRLAQRDLFPVANARKALTGQLHGLLDPTVMKARETAEAALMPTDWTCAWRTSAAPALPATR